MRKDYDGSAVIKTVIFRGGETIDLEVEGSAWFARGRWGRPEDSEPDEGEVEILSIASSRPELVSHFDDLTEEEVKEIEQLIDDKVREQWEWAEDRDAMRRGFYNDPCCD